jgi:undecaprenyl diphosphate synthase
MNMPKHIAVIMDGNGRWAQNQGLKRTKGHEAGAKTVRAITEFCAAHPDIHRLTLYAFSTENWKRPRLEVEFLMQLLERYLTKELPTLLANNIRFEVIGDTRAFSNSLQEKILEVKEKTAHCDALVQSLALNYGAQNEIIRAVNSIKNNAEDITEEMFANALDCKEDVDILIRTGGDQRLSNFLLWQAAYAEFFFIDTLWPDFTPQDLEKIIEQFKTRQRRFGGLV